MQHLMTSGIPNEFQDIFLLGSISLMKKYSARPEDKEVTSISQTALLQDLANSGKHEI